MVQEGDEQYAVAIIWARDDLIAGDHHLRRLREEPSLLDLGQVILGESGSGLAYTRPLLHGKLHH
jgi:hypothetical protein